jgi:glycosyltransferase involved in cell wall biosynthesis
MSIMFLHSSDEGYGSDRVLLQMVRAALDGGYAVTVLLPDDTQPGWLSERLAALDVVVKKGPLAPARRRYLTRRAILPYLWSVVAARRFIRREWRRLDPAVVHVNSTALPVMALAGRPGRAKVVWHVHEILVSPAVLALIFRLAPLVTANRIVAISDAVATHLGRLHIRTNRIVRVYNGVESRHRRPAPPEDEGVTAVFVGRLSGWKGYDIFIDAIAEASPRVPSLAGIIVGSAPPGEEWRTDDVARRISDAGLDGVVRYVGFQDDMSQHLRPGRIVTVPSRWPEPFGLVTVEAMLAGCAVIASRHGGSVEILEDEVTGVLVTPGDASALAAALERLAGDAALRQQLGAQARTSATERFGEDVFAKAMLGLWADLAAG